MLPHRWAFVRMRALFSLPNQLSPRPRLGPLSISRALPPLRAFLHPPLLPRYFRLAPLCMPTPRPLIRLGISRASLTLLSGLHSAFLQVPTLNKMKQQLHQLSVSFAQLTNEALMAWDPELEYKLHLLQEQLLIVKRNEDALDRYDQDEVSRPCGLWSSM